MDDTSPTPPPAWSRRLGVFDLETTGVDVATVRIVTAHVGVIDASGALVQATDWLADPGVEIPDAAARVHGITTARARAEGRPARDVVAEVTAALAALLRGGVPIVAYNASYDFSVLAAEAARHGLEPLHDPRPVIDPLIIDKACDRYRKGKRTLSAAADLYGVRLDDAHEASADAVAAGRVAQALARRYADSLPADADALHEQQVAWARDQAASLTDYFHRVGRMGPGESVDGRWPVR